MKLGTRLRPGSNLSLTHILFESLIACGCFRHGSIATKNTKRHKKGARPHGKLLHQSAHPCYASGIASLPFKFNNFCDFSCFCGQFLVVSISAPLSVEMWVRLRVESGQGVPSRRRRSRASRLPPGMARVGVDEGDHLLDITIVYV